jgi:hypothetical protein
MAEVIDAERSTPMHVLPHNLTVLEPSSEMTRQVPIYTTTCARWVDILTICTTKRKVNLLGVLSNVFLGIFLTALAPAISAYSTEKGFTSTTWPTVAAISAVGFLIAGAVSWQSISIEGASIASLLGELKEVIKRFDREG